ncbi:phage tail-collar fiber domain-containing protein [Burkholderia sp. ISTR5]|uniref:phage tail-collar fiber domain-containing protein n=1 Tax=Burkholderia sp. ISTR5 TaxID=2500161 RepID=UPI0013718D52|nr:phage tail protein [Burkholderia sp. ISTR5]NBI45454.1 phage tail protein [Burkholderia sp. ISTR5]
MIYETIHTKYGRERMAAAAADGEEINIVAIAIGDGGGNPTQPDENQAQLVREVYRAKPNRVYQDPTDPLKWFAELAIPATVGGFTVREMATIDDHGGMFTVSNVPAAYKPMGDGSEGSFGDTMIRQGFYVTNASIVTVQIDPNVALASQSWVENTINVPYLLPGGTTGQVLQKKSNADGDTVWADPTDVNVTVQIVDEVQTLAQGQNVVTLTKCTTVGLAVYIGRQRLLPEEWAADAIDRSKLTLASTYPDGTKAYFVQNDPTAKMQAALAQAQNLADVLDVAKARGNLGVDSKVNTDQHAPAGMIAYFAGQSTPTGWLKANGAAVSRTAFSALFAKIGTTYGNGDGFNTFNLPDLRGEFIRGWDDSRGADPGRTFASWQKATLVGGYDDNFSDVNPSFLYGRETVDYGSDPVTSGLYPGAVGAYIWSAQVQTTPITSGFFSAVRPRNMALLACIKY